MLVIETDSYKLYRYICKLFLKNPKNFLKLHKMDIKKGKNYQSKYIMFIPQTKFLKYCHVLMWFPLFK